MKNAVKTLIVTVILLLLTACEPSNFESKYVSFKGTVVDGYISDANICLDQNYNGVCEDDEPSARSDAFGEYNFSSVEVNDNAYLPVILSGGVDTATGKYFKDELKNLIDTSSISETIPLLITPLTDLTTVLFLKSDVKDSVALDYAKENIADIFSLTQEELYADPMKNVKVFVKTQELQQIKAILALLVTNDKESQTQLLNDIKEVLIAQIRSNPNQPLNLEQVLARAEIYFNILISESEKTFFTEQILEIRRVLETFIEDGSFDSKNLSRLQNYLEKELEVVYSNMKITTLNITNELITQSKYSKTDAIYDELACLKVDSNNVLVNSSFAPRSSDDKNGISISSSYDFNFDMDYTEIKIYYPALVLEKTGDDVIIFDDKYYFSFDKAWINSTNNRIYIETPKDSSGLHSCYKTVLNSIEQADINYTKVYRYSDI